MVMLTSPEQEDKMDLFEYLSKLGLRVTDEDQLNLFLSEKENEIKLNFHQLWADFEQKQAELTSLAPISITEKDDDQEQFNPTTTEINPEEIESLTSKTDNEVNEKNANELFSLNFSQKQINLQNGKVNQPYTIPFNIEGLSDISEYWFEGLEDIGLIFDKEKQIITGIPLYAGEHKIKLLCKRNDWTEGKPTFERVLSLIINPDPKSLWNNLPSDKEDIYWKPDSDCRFLKVESTGLFNKSERKDIVAASQRGRSHAHDGRFRDDDFDMSYNAENQWYIVCVADGAGSAKYSRKGSVIACQAAITTTSGQLESQYKNFDNLIKIYNKDHSEENKKKLGDALYNILGSAVFKAYKNIEKEAQENNNQLKEYSTTLIVSICKKFKFGWFVAAFWVGDGGIGIYNKNTQFLKILGEPDGGEFAGQTRFLTMTEIVQPAELYRRLRFDIVDDFTALILMTDGITDPKFETDANLSRIEKWNDLWIDLSAKVDFKDDNETSAEQLLNWLDFWSPGNHDDRTIAILF